jgi:hypothetical protein
MRKLTLAAILAAAVLAWAGAATAQQSRPADNIDWTYAKKLLDKSNANQKLTPEEQTYLDNARKVRAEIMRRGGPAPEGGASSRPAGGLSTSGTTSTGLVPLDQMTAEQKYKGEDGGLYGGGKNEPPESLQKAAVAQLAKIQPLDEKGKPDPKGKIVLMSMGMSNTTQEFSEFKAQADKDPAKSPAVVIVDCAQGGEDAFKWAAGEQSKNTWDNAIQRLHSAGVTPEQVQVMWVKHARITPERYGDFPAHANELKEQWISSLNLAAKALPNLRIAYLSSRIYAGYASTRLNPEPYAYEGAFAVRKIIQDQIKGDAALNYDAAKGEVKSPLLLWGPYLWADGLSPRKGDGLVWKVGDLAGDGTHPSVESGRAKVAKLLLDFLKTNPNAKGWFTKTGTRD